MTHKTNLSMALRLGLLSSLIGCPAPKDTQDSGDTGGTQTVTIKNEGYACLVDDGTDDLSTGTINVMFDNCLSGCASDLLSSCEATIDGDTIEVTAIGEYSLPLGNVDCPAMCVALSATCAVTGITEAVSWLDYANDTAEVDYPAVPESCTTDLRR